MNTLQRNKFKNYLLNGHYANRTVEIYANSLLLFEPPTNSNWLSLYNELVDYKDKVKIRQSKTEYSNTRAALHLYFHMESGKSIKQFEQSLIKTKNPFHDYILGDFYKYSIHFKKLSETVSIAETHHIRCFLEVNKINSISGLSKITFCNVRDYISNNMKNIKISSKSRYTTSIRNFFRYLKYKDVKIDEGILDLPLKMNQHKNIPPIILTKEEELKLRNHYNKNNKHDIRNKIIILLQLDLGLRVSEVSNLQLANVRWASASIIITNTKTKCDREIPFTEEIGRLLETYVISFRGKSSSDFLILSLNPRKNGLGISVEDARRVVRFAMEKEGVNGYWQGTHTLRRTAASKIYNSKAGLKVTADILGHKSLDSTVKYIKVDFDSMLLIVTPWPGGEINVTN